jgi:four helix bundle protein
MSRDHRRLRVFNDAHALTLAVYRRTNSFPKDEWFGLRMQMRRAAVSVPANIVERCARSTTRDYCNVLNIAVGSASELAYLVRLANELCFLARESGVELQARADAVVRQLKRLHTETDRLAQLEIDRAQRPKAQSLKSGHDSPRPSLLPLPRL